MQFEEGMKKIHAMAGHSQEQLDEIKQGILNMASDETIWVMDSDMCECGALLGYFGECSYCGWDGIDWEDEEEIDYEGYDLDFDEQGRYIGG